MIQSHRDEESKEEESVDLTEMKRGSGWRYVKTFEV